MCVKPEAPVCIRCGKKVSRDEVGLSKKLINRGTETFFCINCLATHLGVSVRLLEQKIIQFRDMGCSLFQ